jgi:UDP-N-acetylglucosamine 1-carboxyvinyltransferase
MSEYLEFVGGTPLKGEIVVGGAKNAALPILIATLLTAEPCELTHVPNITDTNLVCHLLEHFGAHVEFVDGRVTTKTPKLIATEASYSLVKALRASFWVLAPLVARGRAARVALPGGDLIGARPVDIHLDALTKMGADIRVKNGVVFATAVDGLRPITFEFRFPSVGATHQVVMAASLTPGLTVLKGCAREPEVVALADYLNAMGADIQGAGGSVIEVRGRSELGPAAVPLIGDRIEAGTYLLAGAATGGKVKVRGIDPAFLGSLIKILDESGAKVKTGADWIEVERTSAIRPLRVKTGPFPDFATDLQAPLMAYLTLADGTSELEETVYEGRFGHVSELSRMGAKIRIEDRVVRIEGVGKLAAAPVDGLDIRAAASLAIAALSAEGTSQLHDAFHLRRGYEHFERKIGSLGGQVWCRVSDPDDFLFAGC